MSEEDGYNITRAVFESGDGLVAAAKWMEIITPENGLSQMNAPLHAGDYRYNVEAGVEVPEALIPPEGQ